jgi:valyl-tRNA synthetase
MDKRFEFSEAEPKIYKEWEAKGCFNPDHLPGERSENFTIVMPPPNITGSLHMGHALNASVQDVIVRQKRMQGYRTLWLPGFDHAGIATQNVIEKKILKEQEKTRFDLGKDKFLQEIWRWKDDYQIVITNQLKKIGASCDWSRTRFTLDEKYSQAVKQAFHHYYQKGWIYRKERVINWCPRCETALSDLELERIAENSSLWHIRYPLVNQKEFIVIATTRPETIFGDLAIAVNPKDKRYENLIGQKAQLPLTENEIPIIADESIDPEFGTGALKVTPAHDSVDAEIGEKNNLGHKIIIDRAGFLNDQVPEKYRGLKLKEARSQVVEDLEKLNLLEKIEPYQHEVPVCERCQTRTEVIPSEQWFLKMDELAQLAAEPIKSGQIKFYPARWEKIYLNWLENIKDWCLSRQIWWGHPIPLENEEDVLDTWFSSALWPFATMGWPEESSDLLKFYPTDFLSTATEIMNLWVARMIFSGKEFMGEIPFSKVYFHPTILNKEGRRMSKSLGTGIDPLELIEKYGADATRFGLLWQTGANRQDIRFGEEDIAMAQKFVTKIWNASRFIIGQAERNEIQEFDLSKLNEDQEIVKKIKETIKTVNESLSVYRFDQATENIYHFFWHEFCDQYLEQSKEMMQSKEKQEEVFTTLAYLLATTLKLLHPFMPFVTEEIYQMLPIKDKKDLLIVEDWPT